MIEGDSSIKILPKKQVTPFARIKLESKEPVRRGGRKEKAPTPCNNCENTKGVLRLGESVTFCTQFECMMRKLKETTKNLIPAKQ